MNLELIEWVYLNSTKIERIGYFNNNLYVEYKDRENKYKFFKEIYEFENVPETIYTRILNREFLSRRDNLPSYGASLYNLVEKDKQYKPNKIVVKV